MPISERKKTFQKWELAFMSHWQESCHMDTPAYEGGWNQVCFGCYYLCNLTYCSEQKTMMLRWKERWHFGWQQACSASETYLSICNCGSGTSHNFLFVFSVPHSQDCEPMSPFICVDSAEGLVCSFTSVSSFERLMSSPPPFALSETPYCSIPNSLISFLCFPSFAPCAAFWVISSEVFSSLIICWVVLNFCSTIHQVVFFFNWL